MHRSRHRGRWKSINNLHNRIGVLSGFCKHGTTWHICLNSKFKLFCKIFKQINKNKVFYSKNNFIIFL